MTFTETIVTWRGLTLGRGSTFLINPGGVIGWQRTAPTAKEQAINPSGRGFQPSPLRSGGRTVMVAGRTDQLDDRDAAVAAWESGMYLSQDPWATEQLTITMAGRSLTVDAQLAEADMDIAEGWGQGRLTWKARWECDDPRRYAGITDLVVEGPPATAGAGLALSASLPNAFASNPAGGALGVTNTGNAPAPCSIELWGPWTAPGVTVGGGTRFRTVTYSLTLGATDVLEIDTREGAGFLNNTYRAPAAGSDMQGDLELSPGVNSIVGTGTPGSGAKVVVRYRPAFW